MADLLGNDIEAPPQISLAEGNGKKGKSKTSSSSGQKSVESGTTDAANSSSNTLSLSAGPKPTIFNAKKADPLHTAPSPEASSMNSPVSTLNSKKHLAKAEIFSIVNSATPSLSRATRSSSSTATTLIPSGSRKSKLSPSTRTQLLSSAISSAPTANTTFLTAPSTHTQLSSSAISSTPTTNTTFLKALVSRTRASSSTMSSAPTTNTAFLTAPVSRTQLSSTVISNMLSTNTTLGNSSIVSSILSASTAPLVSRIRSARIQVSSMPTANSTFSNSSSLVTGTPAANATFFNATALISSTLLSNSSLSNSSLSNSSLSNSSLSNSSLSIAPSSRTPISQILISSTSLSATPTSIFSGPSSSKSDSSISTAPRSSISISITLVSNVSSFVIQTPLLLYSNKVVTRVSRARKSSIVVSSTPISNASISSISNSSQISSSPVSIAPFTTTISLNSSSKTIAASTLASDVARFGRLINIISGSTSTSTSTSSAISSVLSGSSKTLVADTSSSGALATPTISASTPTISSIAPIDTTIVPSIQAAARPNVTGNVGDAPVIPGTFKLPLLNSGKKLNNNAFTVSGSSAVVDALPITGAIFGGSSGSSLESVIAPISGDSSGLSGATVASGNDLNTGTFSRSGGSSGSVNASAPNPLLFGSSLSIGLIVTGCIVAVMIVLGFVTVIKRQKRSKWSKRNTCETYNFPFKGTGSSNLEMESLDSHDTTPLSANNCASPTYLSAASSKLSSLPSIAIAREIVILVKEDVLVDLPEPKALTATHRNSVHSAKSDAYAYSVFSEVEASEFSFRMASSSEEGNSEGESLRLSVNSVWTNVMSTLNETFQYKDPK